MAVRVLAWLTCVVSVAIVAGSAAFAQDSTRQPRFPKTYDSLDAGRDAQQYAERQRRAAIDRQLGLLSYMQLYAAVPRGSVWRYPPSLGYRYAYPDRRAVRRALNYQRRHAYYGYPGVFEPWPFVRGHIYG